MRDLPVAGEVTTEEVSLIKESAVAFANTAVKLREQAQRAAAQKLAEGGRTITFRVNDQVTFYLPPTAQEARKRGRKVKHLQWYRGPATVTKILSATTYELTYKGVKYRRSIQEIRPHRGAARSNNCGTRTDAASSQQEQASGGYSSTPADSATSYNVGQYVAYRTEKDDRRFHIGRVVGIEENELQVHTHGTSNKQLQHAHWKPIFANKAGQYTTQCPRGRARGGDNKIYDHVPAQAGDGLILLQVHLQSGILDGNSRETLTNQAMQHHLFGSTWP